MTLSTGAAWIALSSSWATGAHPSNNNWKDEALKLESESSEEIAKAAKTLREIPDLDRKLSQAIESGNERERAIAFQTIQNLQRDSLFPFVLEHARRDTDRFVFISFCALSNEKNSAEIARTLEARLAAKTSDRKLTAGAKTAILQCFRTLSLPLTPSTVERLAKDQNSEVKLTAIDLAGSYATERNDPRMSEYESTLLLALRDRSPEIRIRALDWIDKRPTGSSIRRKLQRCLKDKNSQVRARCKEIATP